ncbi:hypothetical protein CLIB1444_03S09516 [[Candida] jaroonii]|uniref:Uncharacterized protein n=1 Tax=[Candida] jaroonii TaxID=467808 RepID=A0ACA9Y5P2_9ASCO|nr:hypothetical protein CLIB1444_03S09516 [[Candida] jaroonii]
MSFYLLPPVSYQTQQKMKAKMEKDKKRKEKKDKRKHSASSSSSTSIYSSQSKDNASIRTNTQVPTSSSSMISMRTPSISSRSPNNQVVSHNKLFNKPNKSIDEISNLDSLSFSSDLNESLLEKDNKKEKKKNHTFNYNYNSEINEFIKYQSKHRPSIKSTNSSIYSKDSYNSHLKYDNYQHNYHNIEFNIGNYSKMDKFDHISNYSIPPDLTPDQGDNEENDILDEDEENKLTRVYSDVDSIFSTKIETPKKGLFKN